MNKIFKTLLFLFVVFYGFLFSSSNNSTLILVSFDGFRYDYMDYADTPNFDFFEKNGVKAKSLKPIFPSFTFPNHYSIATGCYANKHKILGNTFYDVQREEYYSYKNSITVQDGSWYGGEPIWVTAMKNDLTTATYFWIGSEAEIMGYRPDIYKNFIPMVNPYEKVDEVMSWLKLPKSNRPKLILLYFDEPDHSAHAFGSLATETIKQIVEMDQVLGYLMESVDKIDAENQINMVLVSDHGMTDVDKNKIINISKYINEDVFDVYGQGPIVTLRNKKGIINKYFDVQIPNITIFKKDQIPSRFHYVNHNAPDFLMLADENYLMYTEKDINKELTIVGMHGYDPNLINMHGIFYAYGPNFKKNIIIDTFELIHIYPMLCKILDIKPNPNCDGKLKVLENILN